MAQPVVHWEINSRNYKAAHKFYGELFDWDIQHNEEMKYGLVAPAGERSIGGGIGPAQNDQPLLTFYVQVDDIQAYLDKAEKLGGKTLLGPTPIPGIGSCGMFADPDGLVVGLFKS